MSLSVRLGRWLFPLDEENHCHRQFLAPGLEQHVKVGARRLQHLVGRRLSEIDHFLAVRGAGDGQIDLAVQLSRSANPSFQDDIRLVVWFH